VQFSKIKYISSAQSRKEEIDGFISKWFDSNDFFETNTSGSTGIPKTIRIKKKHAIASAKMTLAFFQLTEKNSIGIALSLEGIGGKMALIRAVVGNLEAVILPLSSTPLNECEDFIDFLPLVPYQLEQQLLQNAAKLNLVKTFLLGGSSVKPNLQEQIFNKQLSVYESFGMTETISHFALRNINAEKHFTCLENVNISCENETLVLKIPSLGIERLKTNDRIQRIDSNKFTWLGRTDFIINCGGKKFSPETIEQKIASCISVPFFIFGENDEHLGERICLAVESETDISGLGECFKANLNKYEIPRKKYRYSSFSYTATGKINRLVSIQGTRNEFI
jgi:o-succinylbenzoate---CoA ligase